MSIVSLLPVTLTNGQIADATQVMADLNQIVNNVNANAAALNGNNAFLVGTTQTIGGDVIVTQTATQTLTNKNISGYTPIVDSVAAVRSLLMTGNPRVLVTGYYALRDGIPESLYVYDSTDTTSSDNGGTILVAADTGRWKLVYGAVLTDRQFGVYSDNSHDDTTARQNAITYVQSTYNPVTYASNSPFAGTCTLYYGSGYSLVAGTLTQTKKVAHVGDGPAERSSGTRIQSNATNVDLFQVTPIAQGMSVSFEKMTLVGNGLGGTGNLIHVQVGTGGAACNSQRYEDLVFAQPGANALKIDIGDDIMMRNCLVDIASAAAYSLGTTTSTSVVTNSNWTACRFFSVQQRAFLLFNVIGMDIVAPSGYPSGTITNCQYFLDGYNTTPFQLKNISITGGNLNSYQCIAQLQSVVGFKMTGVNCQNLGLAGSSTLSAIVPVGTCDQISLIGNTFQGQMGTKSFYDDSGATVTNANITGNTFDCAAGMTGAPIKCAGTTGTIGQNYFPGWTGTPVVSQQFYTSGSAIIPGTITAGSSFTYTTTVTGALQGDKITATPSSLIDPIPQGIITRAWVSAANTISFKLMNVTGSGIAVTSFDYGFLVTRG